MTFITLKDNGFYTGDSSYSIAWLALGNRTGGDSQFARTFLYLNGLPDGSVTPKQYNPFNVWKEAAESGMHLNFITGAGGFLQNIFNGYGGLRARADRLEFAPLLPPKITMVRFRNLQYGGAVVSVEYNGVIMSVTLETAAARPLRIVGGPLLAAGQPYTAPVAPFALSFSVTESNS